MAVDSEFMSGEFYGIITAIVWAIGIFPFSLSTRYFHANHINILRLLLATILLTPFILYKENINFLELISFPNQQYWVWLGLSGVIGLALGDYFSFSSFKYIGARNSSIFSTLAPGAALGFGFILIGERINIIGIIGIIITILGVIYISANKQESNKSNINLIGIAHAIAAALCQGAGVVLAKKAYDDNTLEIASFHAAWIRIVIGMTVLFLFQLFNKEIKNLRGELVNPKNKKGVIFLLFGTLFATVLGLSLAMQTISLTNSAVAQTLFSLVPVFAIPLAYIFHKEKAGYSIILGALVAVGGVIILVWRDTILHLLSFS